MQVAEVKSDRRRLELAESLLRRRKKGTSMSKELIPADHYRRLRKLFPVFQETWFASRYANQDRKDAVLVCNERLKKVERITRAFRQAVKTRSFYESDRRILTTFWVDRAGDFLKIKGKRDWPYAAEELQMGAKRLHNKGYTPMAQPSIEAVEATLEGVDEACEAVDDASRNYLYLRMDLKALRVEMDKLLWDLKEHFKYAMRWDSPVHRRAIMKTFGFRFRGEKKQKQKPALIEAPEPDMVTVEAETVDAPKVVETQRLTGKQSPPEIAAKPARLEAKGRSDPSRRPPDPGDT